MDPTTTLFTFMLETHPSVQTVTLVGSWDNFSKHYTMERDVRRDRGQWRGCYSFKDIICDGDQPASSRRNGGLKMGQPYYFYYEVDGSLEIHNPSLPSTSACPYLPGQTVNTMVVPAEISDRNRSASLNALRREEYMTMEPTDKYVPLRPPPAIPDFLGPNYRLPTSHSNTTSNTTINTPVLKHKRSDRSISPTPSWWSPRKLFGRKGSLSSQGSLDRPSEDDEHRDSVTSTSSSEGTRPRPMSPEALKRFLLADDVPASHEVESSDRLELSIPDDIAEEDDDDFLVSTISDMIPKTILSPPPSKPSMSRNNSSHSSSNTLRYIPDNSSMVTLRLVPSNGAGSHRQSTLSSSTFFPKDEGPTSRFSLSSDEGSVFDDDEDTNPASPSTDNDIPSFYHSDDEEEDNDVEDCLSPPMGTSPGKRSALAMGRESLEKSLAQAFQGYRLPRISVDGTKTNGVLTSPSMLPNSGEASVVNSPPLLAMPANSVVDDFVSELKQEGFV